MSVAAGQGGGTIARPLSLLRNRSLGARLVLTLTGIGLVGALAITLLLVGIINPSFGALEARALEAQVERTRAALDELAAKVETAAHDYADRAAGSDGGTRKDAASGTSALAPTLGDPAVDGSAHIGADGRVLMARWIDPAGHADPAGRARLIAAIGTMRPDRLLAQNRSRAFFARLGREIVAIGLARVHGGGGGGTTRGFVVMAHTITPARLARRLRAQELILAEPAQGVLASSASRLTVAVPLLGADGRTVASARFVMVRDVSVLGRRMLLLAVAASTLLLLLLLVMLRRTVGRLVLEPLERVERHMHHVRASGSLVLLDEEERNDEIGSLERSFNAMLRQLQDLREQIEAQSFALGRSESAVALMHNVRNGLNPISTILSHGLRQAPVVERALIERATAELAAGEVPEERRRRLAAFVLAGMDAIEAARLEQMRQLDIGREAMAHVLDIIGEQQALAHERPQLGVVDVTEVIARNATIARYSDECSIALSFPAQPARAKANRVILSQVIGNLFANAAEAIVAAGRNSGSIAVTVAHEDGSVVIRIRDNGEGFEPEAGARLFHREFSTRQHKTGGLGLHWCANSMASMQGSLALMSEGRGLGAVAVLTLPHASELAAAA